MRLRLSKEASADIEEAWLYGAALWGAARADRFVGDLGEKLSLLTRFPKIGRSRAELGDGLRSLPVPPFVIFYRPRADAIEVVRVLHGARDIEGIFESDR
ncbi:MAG: type II toxin-antitoxin system RelE/ParE family toxin [Planctomycetes bacterium]|nr:type II toxin-antitoxin system RelE/ParE family toxin [Planctomycetota bacterium]